MSHVNNVFMFMNGIFRHFYTPSNFTHSKIIFWHSIKVMKCLKSKIKNQISGSKILNIINFPTHSWSLFGNIEMLKLWDSSTTRSKAPQSAKRKLSRSLFTQLPPPYLSWPALWNFDCERQKGKQKNRKTEKLKTKKDWKTEDFLIL